MIYTQEDIDNGIVMRIGTNYYLSSDVQKVLAPRIKPIEVNLD